MKKSEKSDKKNVNSNRQIMNITYIFLLIFIAMIGYFVKFQVEDSDEVINNSYNKREEVLAQSIVRGKILSNDGTVLAETIVAEDGTETRNYPFGSLFAHSVGYSTRGQTGVELLANYKLLTSDSPVLEIAEKDFMGEKNIGNNVITSLDVEISQAAYDAMGDVEGAVIAIEPATGQIITMISKPDFNPNSISENYNALIADETNSNLLNRTTSGLYTPGSTFKLFTLMEYIIENTDYENYAYDCSGEIDVEDYSIKCASGRAHGSEDIYDSFAYSCNSSFVNMGLTLDRDKLGTLCKRLLFNSELPISFPYNESEFVLNGKSSTFETMQTVIGQGKTLVTPIHLAMIAAAIANDGILLQPYMITSVENHYGKQIKKYSPIQYDTLFSAESVQLLKNFMRQVVTYGTGTRLNVDEYTAYGKTGTAQIEDGSHTNSLFMGFAEKDGKKIAICVVLEDMPEGAAPAVPVAKAVFDEYFS